MAKTNGYVVLLKPGHPNANCIGYVAEHVFVMSEHIGRPIAKNENVHHINGIKDDNHLENLVLMTRSAHTSHHLRNRPTMTHCRRGHAFDNANTGKQIHGRICLTCRRTRQLADYYRRCQKHP